MTIRTPIQTVNQHLHHLTFTSHSHRIHLTSLSSRLDMTATKRSWEGNPVINTTTTDTTDTPPAKSAATMDEPSTKILSIFGTFRDELDEHHDRRERIIKTSRDITALSKKIIFSLQRSVLSPHLPSYATNTTIASEP